MTEIAGTQGPSALTKNAGNTQKLRNLIKKTMPESYRGTRDRKEKVHLGTGEKSSLWGDVKGGLVFGTGKFGGKKAKRTLKSGGGGTGD